MHSRQGILHVLCWLNIILRNSHAKIVSNNASSSCNCVCGIRGRYVRIVGGTETQPHEQPWVTALWKHDRLYCGATIISRNVLLTAAHCIYSFAPSEVFVYLGGHNVIHDRQEVKRVSTLLSHEHFDVVSFNNDIGLVRLENPITFGPKVQPACLPSPGAADYSGELGLVMGWGRLGEHREPSEVLQYVTVPVWPQLNCLNSGYGQKRISTNMMCAGFQEGLFDACNGDSGGPMLHKHSSGSLEVIGIISWGRGCARPNFPGIYTRVVNYRLWIENTLSDECFCVRKRS